MIAYYMMFSDDNTTCRSTDACACATGRPRHLYHPPDKDPPALRISHHADSTHQKVVPSGGWGAFLLAPEASSLPRSASSPKMVFPSYLRMSARTVSIV